jgi:hypothetical protein
MISFQCDNRACSQVRRAIYSNGTRTVGPPSQYLSYTHGLVLETSYRSETCVARMLAQPRASSAACFARPSPLNNWSVHQLNERPAAAAPVTACQKPHEHGPMRRPHSRDDSRESHRTPMLGSRSFQLERPARRHLDVLTPDHVETSVASAVMGMGVGKATLGAVVERVESLVDGGYGRRTAPVALARCRAPVVNCSSSSPNSLCAPQAHDAASRARRSK